jgi:hypothetical protein
VVDANQSPIGSMGEPADAIAEGSSGQEMLVEMRQFGDEDWCKSL